MSRIVQRIMDDCLFLTKYLLRINRQPPQSELIAGQSKRKSSDADQLVKHFQTRVARNPRTNIAGRLYLRRYSILINYAGKYFDERLSLQYMYIDDYVICVHYITIKSNP